MSPGLKPAVKFPPFSLEEGIFTVGEALLFFVTTTIGDSPFLIGCFFGTSEIILVGQLLIISVHDVMAKDCQILRYIWKGDPINTDL